MLNHTALATSKRADFKTGSAKRVSEEQNNRPVLSVTVVQEFNAGRLLRMSSSGQRLVALAVLATYDLAARPRTIDGKSKVRIVYDASVYTCGEKQKVNR